MVREAVVKPSTVPVVWSVPPSTVTFSFPLEVPALTNPPRLPPSRRTVISPPMLPPLSAGRVSPSYDPPCMVMSTLPFAVFPPAIRDPAAVPPTTSAAVSIFL